MAKYRALIPVSLVSLLILLLCLSGLLNIALWKRAKQYYKESNATRLTIFSNKNTTVNVNMAAITCRVTMNLRLRIWG